MIQLVLLPEVEIVCRRTQTATAFSHRWVEAIRGD